MNGGPSGFSEYNTNFFFSRSLFGFPLILHYKQYPFLYSSLIFKTFMGFLFWVVADNAPVTRAFIIASALFTVFFGIQGRSAKLGLSYLVLFFFLYLLFVI